MFALNTRNCVPKNEGLCIKYDEFRREIEESAYSPHSFSSGAGGLFWENKSFLLDYAEVSKTDECLYLKRGILY